MNEIEDEPILLALRGLGSKAEGLRQWAALTVTAEGPCPMLGDFVVSGSVRPV